MTVITFAHYIEGENINNFKTMWQQLNEIAEFKKILYIQHPFCTKFKIFLKRKYNPTPPLSYQDMIYAIDNCDG